MRGKIGIYKNNNKNFLDYLDSLHNKILKGVPVEQAKVGYTQDTREDIKKRVTQLRWLNESVPDLYNEGLNLAMNFTNRANADFFGFDISGVCRYIQHTEYNKGSFYDWHQDCFLGESQEGVYERKLSFSIQLSEPDSYTGGDLEFTDDITLTLEEKERLRQKGTIIIFPSFLQHRVTEITEGQRHALVGWREGKQWT
jgi:PKHD-type hydroxylase|tara:strand:+ start:258 stop:851 length:594 start_codon:yes stop_codon:yes gene_type:complete